MNIWIYELTKIAKMRRNLHFEGRHYAKKPSLRFPGLCEDSQSRGSRPMSITNTDGIILKPLHLEFISFDWYIWLRWGSHLYSSGFQVFSIYYYPVPSQIRWIVGEKFWGDEKMTEKIKGTPPGRSYYNYQGVTRTLIWCEGTITPRQLIKVYIP